MRELLHTQSSEGRRTLLCFDFAYAFPRDFAAALQAATGAADHTLPWLAVWEFLRSEIIDDEGTTSDRKPSNRSNRFEVANKVNSLLSESADSCGPFWCASTEAAYQYLPKLGLNSLSSQLKAQSRPKAANVSVMAQQAAACKASRSGIQFNNAVELGRRPFENAERHAFGGIELSRNT